MRKKILTALASILASLGIAGTAMAVSTEFHGDMHNGVIASSNIESNRGNQGSLSTDYISYNGRLGGLGANLANLAVFGKNRPSNVFGATRLRWQFEAKSDDGLARFVYNQEVGSSDWGFVGGGSGRNVQWGLSGDGVNIETRFAYVDFAVPGMGKNHKIMAGLQPININDLVWRETAAGLTYHGKEGENKWQLGWVRGENGGNNNGGVADADNDYFWGKYEAKLAKDFSLGGFFIYADLGEEVSAVRTVGNRNDIYDATYWYLGLEGKMTSGPFSVDAAFVYQGGDIEFQNVKLPSMDRNAWLGTITLGYKFNDNFNMYANYTYVTGDDNPYDKKAKNFDSIDVDVKFGMILFKDGLITDLDRAYSDAPYIGDLGFVHYSIGGKYKFDKQNDIRVEARYMQTAEDLWYVGRKTADDIGVELDFWYNYKYNKNLDLKVEGGYLFAGDVIDLLSVHPKKKESDNIYRFVVGASFKF